MSSTRVIIITRLSVVFLVTAFWWPPEKALGAATISFLQAATGSSGSRRSSSLSANAIMTTAGDLLVAAVTWDMSAGSSVSISDSRGNTWSAATTREVDTRHNQALQIFYARNISGGSDTVVAVPSPAATYMRLVVHEVAGAEQSTPLDQTAVNNAGSGSSISVGPANTTAAGEYLFTVAMNDSSPSTVTFSAGAGFTKRAAAASADNELASADGVQSAAGSISSVWTLSASSSSLAQIATFKAAGVSAPAITSFSANPSVISAGQTAVLSWVVSGNPAPALSIDNGVGTVSGNSVVLVPATTTTYTLTAVNASGSTTAQTTVSVAQPDVTPPSVPASLVASAISASQINLAWAASSDNVGVAGYTIYRGGVQIATTTTTSYSDTGLAASTLCSYTVAAFDAAANASAQSTAATATTFSSAPATISFLQAATASSDGSASSLSANAITTTAGDLLVAAVTWDTGAGSTVSVSDNRGNAWAAATTRQVDTRNNQALQVFYARNIAGGTDTVTATPSRAAAWVRLVVHEVAGADLTAPLDRTAVNNTGSGSSISVGPVTTSADGEYIFTAAMNDSSPPGTFSPGGGYTKRAVAASADNELATADSAQSTAGSVSSAWTLSVSSSSLAQMATFKAGGPSAPAITSFSANPSVISAGQSAVLSWVVSGNPAPALSIDNGVGTVTGGTSAEVTPVTTTTYTLTAVNASGSVTAQATVSLAQPDSTPPSVPTGLLASAVSPSQIALSWAASTDPDVAGQVVSGVAGYQVIRDGTAVATTTTTSYIDSGLNASTTYSYTVRAIDTAGNLSAPSASASATTPETSTGPAFPLKASANGRYLVDRNNLPFLVIGDAPHSIIVNLSDADVATYLSNRGSNGVNTIWIELLCDGYTFGTGSEGQVNYGHDLAGNNPFTRTLSGGYYDLTAPNESYWAHVDYIVRTAATNGIQCFFTPLDEGGWTTTSLVNGTNRCNQYGQFLGARYANSPNVFWNYGNDLTAYDTPTNDDCIVNIARGVRLRDANHPHTVELGWNPATDSLVDPNWRPLVTVNGVYTYYPTYDQCLTAYNRTNMPVLYLEGSYEYEDNGGLTELGTPNVLRRQEYWSLLSGALAGYMNGNYYTVRFVSGWQSHLNTPGMTQMGYFRDFFFGLNWYDLVPDQAHTFLTAGYGTYATSGHVSASNYATAARTADGRTAVIYVPTARTLSLNMAQLSGAANAWWFDPTAGAYSMVSGSPFANTGTRNFTSPGNNSAGDPDWVLVLQTN